MELFWIRGYGDGDPIEEEDLNDQNTDGITNEDAGIEEEDPEYEDTYDLDELEDDIRR